MRRRLFIIASLLAVGELVGLAALLQIFLAPGDAWLVAAILSLTPNLLVVVGPWLLLANRWTNHLRPDAPPEAAREEVVQLPRRILFLRSVAAAALVIVLAPYAARRAQLPTTAAGALAGFAVAMDLAFNLLRTYSCRWVLDSLAAKVYASDPLRYQARTLRERLFVTTNILGIVGTFVSGGFAYFILGAATAEYVETAAFFPIIVLVLAAGFGLDVFRSSKPLVEWAARAPGADPARAFASSASLPYRLAASNLLAWTGAAAAVAYEHWRHGALQASVGQLFAGVVAVGCGTVMYQAVWHQRLLAPLRERVAEELAERSLPIPRGRLSIRGQLLVVFLLLLGFGGAFAFATIDAEHQRVVSGTAAQRAGEELEWVIAHATPEDLADPARLRHNHSGVLALFEVTDSKVWVSIDQLLPEGLVERVHASSVGFAPVPNARASAAWREVAPGGPTLGVITSWRDLDQSSFNRVSLLYVFAILLLAAVGVVWLLAQELAAPIRALERHARRLGRGELDQAILAGSTDEVGSLANALEVSRKSLQQRLKEVRDLNASLEERVTTRTAELQTSNAELGKALQALAAAHEAMVGAEKLASLGRMSAGIAHEVNNPLNFVKNALPPLRRSVEELRASLGSSADAGVEATLDEMEDVVRVMTNGVERMAQILRALLDFSRQAPEAHPQRFDLGEAVRSALALVQHELRNRIEVTVDLGGVDSFVGQAGPLGQVLVNLVKNAAEAIEGPGTIEVKAQRGEGQVELSVRDSGCGMPPEVIRQAFEPFFTTKPVGKGTGLGLSMVHGIVQKHGGTVRISSTPGAGTTVVLVLPQASEDAPDALSEPPQPLVR